METNFSFITLSLSLLKLSHGEEAELLLSGLGCDF